METNNHNIVHCARSWIGTRFLHQGRLKQSATHKGGVDCLGLLIGIATELQLTDAAGKPLTDYDDTHYTHTPNTSMLLHWLATLLKPKPVTQLSAGDVALFRLDGNPQHLAIIADGKTGGLNLIHSYAQARKVVEHELDEHWKKLLVAGYLIQ